MKILKDEHFGNTGHSLKKLSNDTGEALNSFASDVSNVTSDYTKRGRAYVNENPSKSLALAATTGALVGGLLTLAVRHRN